MRTKIPISLIMVTILAILMDCYAGRGLFLMTVMSIGPDYPLLYLCTIIILSVLFIASVTGLCKHKRWGYNIFVALTLVFNFPLVLMDIKYLIKGYINLGIPQIFLMVFFLTFTIYFLKPSTRKLFDKKRSG